MAPAPTASAASALPLASPKPSGGNSGCTIPAAVMAATSDEPCNLLIARRDEQRDQHAARAAACQPSRRSPIISAMPVCWQIRCSPPAAQTMSRMLTDIAEDVRRPGGIAKTAQAQTRLAGDHDADADKEKDQRAADAEDQFPRRSAAERLARNIAERLHHQQQQRDRDRQDEHDVRTTVLFWLGSACRRRSGRDAAAAPIVDCHRAKTAPKTTSRIASGKPNRATRCMRRQEWRWPRSAPASANEAVAGRDRQPQVKVPLSRLCANRRRWAARSGVRSANADAGNAPMPGDQAETAPRFAGESHGRAFASRAALPPAGRMPSWFRRDRQ